MSCIFLLREHSDERNGESSEANIAVAANFSETANELAELFRKQTGHEVTLSFGSTGKHYAQITNGAPFDAFLAADAVRPKLLEDNGLTILNTRFTYAIGKVALWSSKEGYIDSQGAILAQGTFDYLAIANPRLAPYGEAAKEALESLGLWQSLEKRIICGETISQAFQFVQSRSAELGFIAYSQIKRPGHAMCGSFWLVPQNLYNPLEQQAVLLTSNTIAKAFLDFMRGSEARAVIGGYGYGLP